MQKSCDDNDNNDKNWESGRGKKGYQSHPVTEDWT